MPSGAAEIPTRIVVRKLACTVIGVFLFAAGLTLLWLGMRAVMDVGGYCASGGPYEIRQECPDGSGLIVLGIFAGLIGTGLTAVGTFAGGPQLWTLAWPALFCSLGWNFLEYGIDPPPPEHGPVWGWLVCAVAFLAMGGIPLVGIALAARSLLWGRSDAPATTPRAAVRALRPGRGVTRAPTTPFGSTTVTTPPPEPPSTDATSALVRDLERLAALHREGALDDDEFTRAKTARLAEERS